MKKKRIVLVSGGFDPIHIGHIEYITEASYLGSKLFVLINSNKFLEAKKGYWVMSMAERSKILSSIRGVDLVIPVIDTDATCNNTLKMIHTLFGNLYELVFAKGGDRNNDNIPEKEICCKLKIKIIDDVGGSKIKSSREIINAVRNKETMGMLCNDSKSLLLEDQAPFHIARQRNIETKT